MAKRIAKPTNPYDPAWSLYAAQNPGLRRSLSAGDIDDDDNSGGAVDYSGVLPDTFKGEDGAWDVDGFRAEHDRLVSFEAQTSEAMAGLPEKPEDYAWSIGEEHALPEGFDPSLFAEKDADGNDVEFDVSKMLDEEDPDLPLLRAALHEFKAPAGLMSKLAGIMVNRELRSVMGDADAANKEMEKLGPQGQARKATVQREIEHRLPKDQAKAVLQGVGSADALRGLEALLKKSSSTASSAGSQTDFASMTADERIAEGLKLRKRA